VSTPPFRLYHSSMLLTIIPETRWNPAHIALAADAIE
jgi:hypothetical protein